MPTCLEAAGADYPETREGRRITPLPGESLLPVLRGEPADPDRVIYWEHEGNRAVRQGKWKLVARHRGPWELYDLEADRTEMHDLAADHPQRVRKMSALHEDWAKRSNVVPWDEARPRRHGEAVIFLASGAWWMDVHSL
jgi:arylsulfatase A-like enzyme